MNKNIYIMEEKMGLSWQKFVSGALISLLLFGCSGITKKDTRKKQLGATISLAKIEAEGARREIVLYTLALLGIKYQFGGTHPSAGLDCSGMVGFIYKHAIGIQLPRSAADIAKVSRALSRHQLQAGDFVFFNTMNRPYSHMGIYLGDNKFVHAPSSRSHIKVASLDTPYFATRFQGGGTVFH